MTTSEPELVSALTPADRRLLNLLRKAGRIDAARAAAIERTAADERISVIDAIVASALMSDADIAKTVSDALKVPLLDLSAATFEERAGERIDEKAARKYAVVPIRVENDVLVVATANPLDHESLKSLEFATGLGLRPVVASREQILEAIQRLYRRHDAALDAMLAGVEPAGSLEIVKAGDGGAGPVDVRTVAREAATPPIVKLVNMILLEAYNARASDIHIEPRPNVVLVRYRVDGILEDNLQIPKWVQASIVARIKVMAKLDITERRLPQDGHFAVRFASSVVDIRVSSMPTAYGEKLVLRLLDPSQGLRRLADIGLVEHDLATLKRLIDRPEGMVLVTGPTGSGKTTTLYAAIQEIASSEINIVTIENPIEYELGGVSQIPINEKQGLTFAAVLRSVLRQDPDVIFVGEIRDRETAEIAFQAAQTGHLVLSTVHTNDTAATVTRLLELGVEPHVVGPSLLGIVAQRLVRKVCAQCSEPGPVSDEIRDRLGLPEGQPLRRGRGCAACRNTGFSGRTGCYEVLEVTKAIEQLIGERAPESTIRAMAEEHGMTSILEDARRKILDGITTPSEVLRVVELDTKRRLACPRCHGTIEETFSVCPFCRTQLRLTCPRCDAPLKPKWTACPFCGTGVASLPEPQGPVPAGAHEAPKDTPPAAAMPRILVVHEDSRTLDRIRRAFTDAGGRFEIDVAPTGEQALARASAQTPDLVVVDHAADAADAEDLCRRLRSGAKTAAVPIIALAERGDADAMRRAFHAGANDTLAKPVDPAELLARVERLLQESVEAPAPVRLVAQ
jgi:type II secretory ATPase GspE/PulE/Tfp pilus assembly ATPase PilB-like protein/CheY-like chemotaxis protein